MPDDRSEIVAEIKKQIGGIMTTVEAFKETMTEAEAERKKLGEVTGETNAKLDRINEALGTADDISARLQKADDIEKAAAKAAEETKAALAGMIAEGVKLSERVAGIEVALKRPPGSSGGLSEAEAKAEEYKGLFWGGIRQGWENLSADDMAIVNEVKALVIGDDTLGGYYAAPSTFEAEIIKAIIEFSPFRTVARITGIGTRSLLIPKRTGVFAARRVAEVEVRSETEGYTTGMVEIPAPEMYADTRVSLQMLEDTGFNLEAELNSEIAEQFAVKEGAEFIGGNGAEEAEGILTNSDVLETNSGSASSIADTDGQADGLIDLFHGIKTGYSASSTWLLNRLTLGDVRKLKDADKNYIWVMGLADLRPNTILSAPYVEMPDMPDVAANAFPIMFGDFRRAYRIVDRVGMSVLRDPFTLGNVGQIKLLARKRVGGKVILAEAMRKLKVSV